MPTYNSYLPVLGLCTSKDSQEQVCHVGFASGMLARFPGTDALALNSRTRPRRAAKTSECLSE